MEGKIGGMQAAGGMGRGREEEDSFLDWNGKATLFEDDEELEEEGLDEDESLDDEDEEDEDEELD